MQDPPGASVLRLRQAKGWSRERLAAEAGVSLATVWRLEHGRYPRVEHLVAIADAFDTSLDDLLARRQVSASERNDPGSEQRADRVRL